MATRQRFFQGAFRVLQGSGLGRAMAPFTQGCGALFMLHNVRPARDCVFQPNKHLEVTPEFLTAAVERIRRNGYEIIALDEAVDLLKSGYGRERYAVLTFDDGYRDNLEVAYPTLKALNAPFTIYIASGLVDRIAPVWWVALERIIAANETIVLEGLPATGARTGSLPDNGIPCRTAEEKNTCYAHLVDWLTREVSESDQRQIIELLAERYAFDLTGLSDELMMTWDDLRQLSSDPLVTLGAHTHGHHALARLSSGAALDDVMTGVMRMQAELGQKPRHFAYPYGNELAVSSRDADLLRDAGFSSAVTTFPGVLRSANARDLMLLPRVSLNGRFQDPYIIDQYLTGAPFALYRAARWAQRGFGLRSGISRLFPSTR